MIATLGIVWRRAGVARLVTRTALVIAVATAGLMVRTANLGGKIRHAELRGATTAQREDERGQQEGREEGEQHE